LKVDALDGSCSTASVAEGDAAVQEGAETGSRRGASDTMAKMRFLSKNRSVFRIVHQSNGAMFAAGIEFVVILNLEDITKKPELCQAEILEKIICCIWHGALWRRRKKTFLFSIYWLTYSAIRIGLFTLGVYFALPARGRNAFLSSEGSPAPILSNQPPC
jgi:hypothetical protein